MVKHTQTICQQQPANYGIVCVCVCKGLKETTIAKISIPSSAHKSLIYGLEDQFSGFFLGFS